MNTSVWNRTSTPAINCMRKLQRNSRDYQKRSTARRCGVYCLRSFLREQSSALFLVMILYCCIRHVQHFFVVIVNSWFYIIYWEGSVSMPWFLYFYPVITIWFQAWQEATDQLYASRKSFHNVSLVELGYASIIRTCHHRAITVVGEKPEFNSRFYFLCLQTSMLYSCCLNDLQSKKKLGLLKPAIGFLQAQVSFRCSRLRHYTFWCANYLATLFRSLSFEWVPKWARQSLNKSLGNSLPT